MPSDRYTRTRGSRGRGQAKRRALTKALNAHPSIGVRQERTGRFFPNHHREQHALTAHVPDEAPRDEYFIAAPGAEYVEVCDAGCTFPGQHPECRVCGGHYFIRRETIHGRR